MKVEIITIGDELLLGQVVDTNSAYIAHNISKFGFSIQQITSTSDNYHHISSALTAAALRGANIVIVTGGLGPTKDDITKSAFAEYLDDKLVIHQESLQHIEILLAARGVEMNVLNVKQAEILSRCIPLHNNCGTASGMWCEKDGIVYVLMPGVPFEMKTMMENELMPMLKKRFTKGDNIHKTLLITGYAESTLSLYIQEWEERLPQNIRLAYLPGGSMIRLRLSSNSGDIEQLETEIVKLRQLLGNNILSETEEFIEQVVARLLTERKQTVATAESCTAGAIANKLTSISGSSAYYKGSIIAYSNDVKEKICKVATQTIQKYGAVSEQTVTEMAANVRHIIGTDYAIAVSGVAGPSGGTPQKPVGTIWIAIASEKNVTTKLLKCGNNRQDNVHRATNGALNLLREVILGTFADCQVEYIGVVDRESEVIN
jgi:nicotinamide-nucleotide amidase